MRLESRQCLNCQHSFKVMNTSPQRYCHDICFREHTGTKKEPGETWKREKKSWIDEQREISRKKNAGPQILSSGRPKSSETEKKDLAPTVKNTWPPKERDIKEMPKSSIENAGSDKRETMKDIESNGTPGMPETELIKTEKKLNGELEETQPKDSLLPSVNLNVEQFLSTNYLDDSLKQMQRLVKKLNPHLDNEARGLLLPEVEMTVKIFQEMRVHMKTKLDILKFVNEINPLKPEENKK